MKLSFDDKAIYFVSPSYYVITDEVKGVFPVKISEARMHFKRWDLGKDVEFEMFIQMIEGFSSTISYTEETSISIGSDNVLRYISNPMTSDWEFDAATATPNEAAIISDYENIWSNKLDSIVKLIASSIVYGEDKLQKLFIVGPSGIGKTKLTQLLGFNRFGSNEFNYAMEGKSGISEQQSKSLQKSGLLAVDDVESLTLDFKGILDDVSMRVMYCGTIAHQLNMMVMTSTTDKALGGMSEEMFGRILMVEVPKNLGCVSITDSRLYAADSKIYKSVSEKYLMGLFYKYVTAPISEVDFRVLQNSFKMKTGFSEFVETIEDIEIEIKASIERASKVNAEVVSVGSSYYVTKKSFVKNIIREIMSGHTVSDPKKVEKQMMDSIVGSRTTVDRSIMYHLDISTTSRVKASYVNGSLMQKEQDAAEKAKYLAEEN